MEAQDAISAIYTINGMHGAVVLIATEPQLCSSLETKNLSPNVQLLTIGLAVLDLQTQTVHEPTKPGKFDVVGASSSGGSFTTQAAVVQYLETNASGGTEGSIKGKSGVVNVTSAGADGSYQGNGDVIMDNGDHVTFDFNASACAGLAALFGQGDTQSSSSAKGAFSASFGGAPTGQCNLAKQNIALGEVSPTAVTSELNGSGNGAVVFCSISGSTSIQLSAQIDDTSGTGTEAIVDIPSITPAATKDAPASGTLSLTTTAAGETYSGACDFYLADGTPETVNSDRVWVSFSCPGLSASQSVCALDEGTLVFEGCTN